jgi:DNA topoisomerase-3
MSKILILAEKPNLGRDIAAALGVEQTNQHGHHENDEYVIAPLSGHLLEAIYPKIPYTKENLPLPSLDNPAMQPKEDGGYITNRVKAVTEEIKRNDITEIVSAGDPDQEGSLLVYEMLEYTNVLTSKKITRIWHLAVDEVTLREAFKNRYSIEKDLPYIEAAKARAFADVTIGFNLSRLFTMLSENRDFSASIGRVRTALMQIVRHRELEIENFVPVLYYNIKGFFENELEATLIADNPDEEAKQKTTTRIPLEYYKENNLQELFESKPAFKVVEVDTSEKTTSPDLLPNQNDVLKSISKLHKVKSKAVVEAMQTLYEKQFISYPRTSKRHLTESLYPKLLPVFENLVSLYDTHIGDNPIVLNQSNKRIFDDSKVEEHFAVVPWGVKSSDDIATLSTLEKQTYDYIVAKFLMACMNPYKYDASSIILDCDGIQFKATGKMENSKGFKAYDYMTNETKSKDVILPKVSKDETLNLIKYESKEDKTKPPSLLKESDLLELMENVNKLYQKQYEELSDEEEYYQEKFELGTPATRPGIIDSVIENYKYLEFNSKEQLVTTPVGKYLLELVGNAINIKMTATFENEMQKIQKDKSLASEFKKSIEVYVQEIIEKYKEAIPDTPQKKVIENVSCPLCGASIIQTAKTFKCEKNIYKDGKQSGCKFSIFIDQSKFFGRALNTDDLNFLLNESREDNPLIDKSLGIYLDVNNKYFIVVKFEKKETTPGKLYETAKQFRLNDLWIWKQQRFKDLTPKEAKALLEGEEVILIRKTKKGKSYKVFATLNKPNDGNLTWRLPDKN